LINYNNFDIYELKKNQNNKLDVHCCGKLFDGGVKTDPAQRVILKTTPTPKSQQLWFLSSYV